MSGTVIVGAGHAGVQAAVSLRQAGYQEPIWLVGEEDCPPYHRPPLSKAMLAGEKGPEQIALRGPDFYERNGIELLPGTRALALDPASRTVRLQDGALAYDKAVLATGAGARTLEGFGYANVFHLRSMRDALALQDARGSSSSAAGSSGWRWPPPRASSGFRSMSSRPRSGC